MNKLIILATTLLLSTAISYADNHHKKDQPVKDAVEKTASVSQEAYEDTAKNVKKVYRKAKDKTCEMINGKLECTVQKAENKMKNLKDEAIDKANDLTRE